MTEKKRKKKETERKKKVLKKNHEWLNAFYKMKLGGSQ